MLQRSKTNIFGHKKRKFGLKIVNDRIDFEPFQRKRDIVCVALQYSHRTLLWIFVVRTRLNRNMNVIARFTVNPIFIALSSFVGELTFVSVTWKELLHVKQHCFHDTCWDFLFYWREIFKFGSLFSNPLLVNEYYYLNLIDYIVLFTC